MPKVSVIVPNYNHAPYLRQRLDSIFNQTFQDFEVIILDDCSTDNSKEIIEQYRSNPKVSHIVYNETNSGSPFKQWAKGFKLAQGEYIWIAESDDWAESTFLETLLSKINSREQNSISFCNSYLEKKDISIEYPICKFDFSVNGKKFVKNKMLFDNAIYNASSAIVSKKTIHRISNQFTEFESAGDYQFWLEICSLSKIHYTKVALNHFRLHNLNTTKIHQKNFLIYSEILKILKELQHKKIISKIQLQSVAYHYHTILKRTKAPNTTLQPWSNEIKNHIAASLYKKIYFSAQIIRNFFKWI